MSRSTPEPFFSAEPAGANPARRLLLISYHFPPAQTAGALRWQKLARHAAERGWGLDVVTRDPADVTPLDRARLEELPSGTRVYGVRERVLPLDRLESRVWKLLRAHVLDAGEGGIGGAVPRSTRPESLGRDEILRGIRSRRDLVRAFHAWRAVAQEETWARDATRLARQLVEPGRHRALVTCGPPHMVHHAGRLLARRVGLPLVVDMRDPWSLVERLPESLASPVWLRVAARRERQAVTAARLVVANTEPARDALRRLYPLHAGRIITVMNGYDDEPVPARAPGDRFVIAYAGSIYLDRDPGVLFRPAARLVREFELKPHELTVEMMGNVHAFDGVAIEDLARAAGLERHLVVHPPGSRAAALEFLAGASLLVSLPQDSDMAIPSKIFEYLQFPAWVLAMADPGSATATALRDSGADVEPGRDEDRIYRVLKRRFLEFREGVRPERPSADGHLSRRHQARLLFDTLERCLDDGGIETGLGRGTETAQEVAGAAPRISSGTESTRGVSASRYSAS